MSAQIFDTKMRPFLDFAQSAGPMLTHSPREISNQATKRNYMVGYLLDGQDTRRTFGGGTQMRFLILFDENRSYQHYNPHTPFTYNLVDKHQTGVAHYRFTQGNYSFTDHEVILNSGGDTVRARFDRWADFLYMKEQAFFTGFVGGMEQDLYAMPDAAAMESPTGLLPYSLFCFANELNVAEHGASGTVVNFTGGGSGNVTRDGMYPGWSQLHCLDPLLHPRWDNQRQKYTTTGFQSDLFINMSKLSHELKFQPLPFKSEYSDGPQMPRFWATDLTGAVLYEDSLRSNQDSYVYAGRQDPSFGSPTFRGVPVKEFEGLRNAAVFPTLANGSGGTMTGADSAPLLAGGGANSANVDNYGPRFFAIESDAINCWFHESRFMYKIPNITAPQTPMTHTVMYDMWHNKTCTGRRCLGVLYPGANVERRVQAGSLEAIQDLGTT